MNKVRYELDDGTIQLIDIPGKVMNNIKKESYNHALDDVDNIITEQLDKSNNQIECQTLRWVLDILQDIVK